MSYKVKDVVQLMEALAPKSLAMKWDNVGLQIGSLESPVHKVLVCLDITKDVIAEAIKEKVDLIIAHHPFIFSPLKKIVKEDIKGNLILQAIEHKINIYAAHTNIDIATGGLNDHVAKLLGLKELELIEVTETEELYKIVVFVPKGHEDQVADALAKGGAGHIGNYSHCTYRTQGEGTFMPLEGTNPFIGERGTLERVEEVRVETIVPKEKLNKVLGYMKEAHPYEEVAYDIYPLKNSGSTLGIGRVGALEQPTQLGVYAETVKAALGIEKLRVVGNVNTTVQRICVVNGSGADFIGKAMRAGCDCLVTGDVKYHEAQDALELGMSIIDPGHFESEAMFPDLVVSYLKEEAKNRDMELCFMVSEIYSNPFQIL